MHRSKTADVKIGLFRLLWDSLPSKRFRSIGLSAGLKPFSIFERAKIGASAKKCEKGEGKGGKETLARIPHDFEKPVRPRMEFPDWRSTVSFPRLPSPSPLLPSVLHLASIFAPPKSENASNGRKNLPKRLLRRLAGSVGKPGTIFEVTVVALALFKVISELYHGNNHLTLSTRWPLLLPIFARWMAFLASSVLIVPL